ncbi:ABC transporter permease [Halodesulfovibrio aestuarii]|uniref:ABC transporter permease n=1 Tax=Halodesulfovibrio aestuarii TaxID=126333 RepID=A0A8G2CAW5_9BACT|nr:proline/glycine betaine ABC transporter permease [Halodesulfovibrio aestuarii]SHJ26241.1 glycine betaine/proline transport system permease protein [Halodesulfovibrio aestuarii]
MFNGNFIPLDESIIPLSEWISDGIDWLVYNFRDVFQVIKVPVEVTLTGLSTALNALPFYIPILCITLLAWKFAGKRLALFSLLSFSLIACLGLWEATMTTLAMVLASVLFCSVIGIPLGVLAGRSSLFEAFLRPVLDAMQTTPAFVYLVPIVMLFSIGNTAGVIATIIFALPPIIRLTCLGIRQVHPELVEAAQAFGASEFQVLWQVQLPLALPTILAGLNQTIMMALSMVVIAALIGAGGLGSPVVLGLNTLDTGQAAVGGIAIVLLAVILDRLTQAIANK